MSVFLGRICRFCVISIALLLGTLQVARAEVSMLTIDGEVRTLASNFVATQRRIGVAESGHPVIVDEFAAIRIGDRGAEPSFMTEALQSARTKIAAFDVRSFSGRSDLTSEMQRLPSQEALLIVHQDGHPPNHNFTPTPMAEFIAQAVDAAGLEGQRGFAIVDIGESGRVTRLKVLANGKVVADRNLENAIIDGLKTTFKDERRHDHTVYMAYQLRGQSISQVGSLVVTLPQCGPICP